MSKREERIEQLTIDLYDMKIVIDELKSRDIDIADCPRTWGVVVNRLESIISELESYDDQWGLNKSDES